MDKYLNEFAPNIAPRFSLRQQLGEEDAAKTQALREWLQGHPKRNLILQWLNRP